MRILARAKEIYAYREMVYNLVRRDLHGRYKRSFFGFAWTFLNPLLQLIVYTIVFSTIMRAGIDKFYLFLFVALIPWTFFSASLTGGCGSVLAQGGMVKKIYFPREVLPIAFVTTSFVNMLYCFVVVFAVVAVSGVGFSLRALLCLPFVMLVEYVICLGIALLTSAVTVYCRDMEYMLGIVSMLWMYLTPVLYPISMVPRRYLPLFMLNPMTPVITAYRDILYAAKTPELSTLLHSLAMGVLVLGVGWYVFEKLQRGFCGGTVTMKAIQVHDVAKRFKIYYDRNRTLKERLLFRQRNRYDERWVLKDISFDIEQGEAVGLVGENGCGKSTTLKLLSRILFPDRGTIAVNGRVSCLIELGAGFHPDMNGIENIYLNAAMFGVGRKETSKRLDRIIAFSELEPFIENPIRTYSSGMYMRLAFSVAINVDADVLLIDEILAVGDMNFQEKCLARLREIKERGATIVIVSHSLGQIETFCGRSIWIDGGRVRADGTPAETHARYAAFMDGKKAQP